MTAFRIEFPYLLLFRDLVCPYPEPSSSSLALEYLTPCSVASDPLHPEALPPHLTYSLSVPLVCVPCGHSASSLGSEPLSPEHFHVPSLCPGLHELSLQILPAAVSTLLCPHPHPGPGLHLIAPQADPCLLPVPASVIHVDTKPSSQTLFPSCHLPRDLLCPPRSQWRFGWCSVGPLKPLQGKHRAGGAHFTSGNFCFVLVLTCWVSMQFCF